MTIQSTRDGFGLGLKEIAEYDKDVIAMDCDLGRSTRSFQITEIDKSRFIEMGIAEQDMISTAVGMSLMGKTVFVNSFAIFVTGRCFDQIRQQVALPSCNIKICGSSAGLTQGADGATHQALIDAALMRLLPNMTVISPADPEQARLAVWEAYKIKGPVYLRLSRFDTGNFMPENLDFECGKAQKIQEGKDAAIIASGPILNNALKASEMLEAKGISVELFNFHTLKPFDRKTINSLIGKFSLVFSVEEHSISGGIGTAAAEIIAESSSQEKIRLFRLGINDTFGESASAEELLHKHKLSAVEIANRIENELKKI